MIFLDTSALVKRYAIESGSDEVLRLMDEDAGWAASAATRTEAEVTLCHLGPEGRPGSAVHRRLQDDWDRFAVVPVDADCLAHAAAIGCEQRLRTLDAIHLAAALRLPAPLDFLTFDHQQAAAARRLGLVLAYTRI
ncbi:hypothetical protein BH23CHL8_BH23CHL8_28730 [soil metagenome]